MSLDLVGELGDRWNESQRSNPSELHVDQRQNDSIYILPIYTTKLDLIERYLRYMYICVYIAIYIKSYI